MQTKDADNCEWVRQYMKSTSIYDVGNPRHPGLVGHFLGWEPGDPQWVGQRQEKKEGYVLSMDIEPLIRNFQVNVPAKWDIVSPL